MLGVKMACSFTQTFFRPEVDSDLNMAQAGEENRNHLWSDLSRFVDVGCKNGL